MSTKPPDLQIWWALLEKSCLGYRGLFLKYSYTWRSDYLKYLQVPISAVKEYFTIVNTFSIRTSWRTTEILLYIYYRWRT